MFVNKVKWWCKLSKVFLKFWKIPFAINDLETALDYSSGIFKSSTYHSFHFAFGEHGLASVIGLDLVEHPGLAPVLLDLLHQVVPVRPLCRPLLQSLHSATLGFFWRRQAWRWRRWRRCWRCWWCRWCPCWCWWYGRLHV